MNVSEVMLSESFLSEVIWAKDMVMKIMEYKIKNLPMGLHQDMTRPEELLVGFARRGLVLATYVRHAGFALGSPEAYVQNIGTIVNYIQHLRQQEIRSANDKINEVLSFKSHDWAIGLAWPDGQPDGFARYFAIRGLPIALYLRGNVNVGDDSAYDKNIETLNSYIIKVGAATIR
jgi:hypothetical protein